MTNATLETTSIPIQDGFRRLGVRATKGAELVKSGELRTFTIGTRRYITEAEIYRFIRSRMKEAAKETAADRVGKVAKAVAGRQKQRAAVEA